MGISYQSRRYALLNSPIDATLQLRRVHRHLRPRPRDRVLDVGCGRGYLLREIQRYAPAATGIDVNAHAIAHGVTRNMRVMDAQRLDFPDESFDKIYSIHAIEHVPDLAAAFAEMDRVLRPGGVIVLEYPAEPVRGLYVIPTALILFGNPLRARDLHLHRLTPGRVAAFVGHTALRVVHSTFHLLMTPQFVTVLRKDGRPPRVANAAPRALDRAG